MNLVWAVATDAELLRAYLGLGYGLQTLVYLFLSLYRHRFACIRLVQPSLLTMIYIGLSLAVGAWAFSTGNVIRTRDMLIYYSWANIAEVYLTLSAGLLMLFLVSLRSGVLSTKLGPTLPQNRSGSAQEWGVFGLLSMLFLAALLITHPLLSQVRTVLLASIIYLAFARRLRLRWIFTFALITIAAAVSFHSKREAIFALAALGLVAFSATPFRPVRGRDLIAASVAAAAAVILVVAMSILRGYGYYSPAGLVDAIGFIPSYLSNTKVLALLSLNFETTYIFQHLHNAASNALINPDLLELGETYIRPLFIGPIGELVGYKPESVIHSYTVFADPNFRAAGGSFGITSLGEGVWNFGAAGFLMLPFLYAMFDTLFFAAVRALRGRSIYFGILSLCGIQFLLYYSRGSGLDLLLIYLLLAAVIAYPISFIIRMALEAGTAGYGARRIHAAEKGQ